MYWITGTMGFFMMIAPYVFNYADNQTALWISIASGLIVLGVSVWEGAEHDKAEWEYYVAAIVGIFAIVAPFLFGFASIAAMWTTVIAGAIIAVVAVSRIWIGGPLRI